MPTIEESLDVAASPMAVHDVLMDLEAAPLWTSGLESLELIEGTPGEPGCLGHAHYVEGSRRYVIEDRLIEAIPGIRYRSKIAGGGLRATVDTRLEEVPIGTRVTIRWEGRGTNPITKLALALLRRRVSRRTRDDMRALRVLVEKRGLG